MKQIMRTAREKQSYKNSQQVSDAKTGGAYAGAKEYIPWAAKFQITGSRQFPTGKFLFFLVKRRSSIRGVGTLVRTREGKSTK